VTALHWAAHWNDLEMADRLIAARANVNAADDHGVTPLIRACENASEPMVRKLLAAGANPSLAQSNGLTPLMIASRTGSAEVVAALLARGAAVNATTREADATALMWAITHRHREIIRALLRAGADVKGSTAKGFTPLMFAARNGDVETAKLLVEAGADVNALGADRTHVLPYAIMQGQEPFALFLLEQGANPNATIEGVPALHAAAGSIGPWLNGWSTRHGVSSGPLAGALGGGGGQPGRVRLSADRERRRPQQPPRELGDVHDLRRLSEKGRVRTLRHRHRRSEWRDAAVGGGVCRQRRRVWRNGRRC
jgi:hypothetical protein